jgi:hypothetical protein
MQEEWNLRFQPYDEWVDYINRINIYLHWNILMISYKNKGKST